MKKFLILFAILIVSLEAYVKPEAISEEIWQQVTPYLLPENHPIKPKLDKLFSKKRHTHDHVTLFGGEFDFKVRKKWDQIIVAKHHKLKNFILKLYLDTQIGLPDWDMWIRRIRGAECIRETIKNIGAEQYFKVPKKWIYVLPEQPAPLAGTQPKHFIMVVEDMHIKSALRNERIWKDPFEMTAMRMKALYKIIAQAGLNDSVYIDNIPFCSDYKQAFIDTEHYGKGPIRFDYLLKRLPKTFRPYWQELIRTNGEAN